MDDRDLVALAILCAEFQVGKEREYSGPDCPFPEGMVWEAYRVADAVMKIRECEITPEGWDKFWVYSEETEDE